MDERRLAELGGGQDGVVSLEQVEALGLHRRSVASRVASGRWRRLHPGVYALGPAPLRRRGRWIAAVLASGADAALSHRDAAALHGFGQPGAGAIDVSTPHRSRRGVAGVRLHRPRRLDPDDVTEVDGVRITTVARTLVDLAGTRPADSVRRAVHEAEVQRVLDVAAVLLIIGHSNGRRGLKGLERALGSPEPPTRNAFERRFAELMAASDLPPPRTNAYIDVGARLAEVDAVWPEQLLIVELDSHRVHTTRKVFESDRQKDIDLLLRGYRVVRVTWRRLITEPEKLVAELRALLYGQRAGVAGTRERPMSLTNGSAPAAQAFRTEAAVPRASPRRT
jgi:hypothetical protein